MSGTLTIRPNALIGQTGWVASAGTINGATSDNSDTTYVTDTTGGNAYAYSYFDLNFATATLPAGAVIRKVTPFIRCSQASGSVKLRIECNKDFSFFGTDRNKYTIPTTDVTPTSTIKTFTLGAGGTFKPYQDFFNTILPQAVVDGLSMRVRSLSSNNAADDHRVHDVWFNVEYDEAPQASGLALSPSDANVRTVRPKIVWTYADPEGSPQQGFNLVIWNQADTLDAKFAAFGDGTGNGYTYSVYSFTASDGTVRTPAYLWSDGASGESGHKLTKDLPNNATYVAYVRVFDAQGGGLDRGIGGQLTYPTSTGFTFTMQVPVPPPPAGGAITATYEKTKYRVKLDLAAQTPTTEATTATMETIPSGTTAGNATITAETNVSNVMTGIGSVKAASVAAGNWSMGFTASGLRSDITGYYASGAGALCLVNLKRSTSRDVLVTATVYNAAGGTITSKTATWYGAQSTASLSATGFVPVLIKFTNAELTSAATTIGFAVQANGATAAAENLWIDSVAVRPARGGINWLSNASFERGTTAPGDHWAYASFGAPLTSPVTAWRALTDADAALQMFGSRAVRLTGTAGAVGQFTGLVQYTTVCPTAGTTVRYGANWEFYTAPAGSTAVVNVLFYNSANTQVGTTATASASPATVNGRVIAQPRGSVAVPAGAVYMQIQTYFRSGAAGAVNVTVDGAYVTDGAAAPASGELPQTEWTIPGLPATQVAIVQRSFDNGLNWWPIPAMAVDASGDMIGAALGTSTGQTATVYDTLVIPGASPWYRFRTRSYDSSLDLYIYSDWSPPVQCTGSAVTDGTGVHALRSVTDPDFYVALPLEDSEGFTYKSGTSQGVFYPIGGTYPIVVNDSIQGEVLPFKAMYRNGFDSSTLLNLRASKQMLWMPRDVDGAAWFVQFTGDLEVTDIRNSGRGSAFTRATRISGTLSRVSGPAGQPAWFWVS